jgi:hypothetical protein
MEYWLGRGNRWGIYGELHPLLCRVKLIASRAVRQASREWNGNNQRGKQILYSAEIGKILYCTVHEYEFII